MERDALSGFMEVVWKVVAAILNLRLTTSVTFHNFLHGFRVGHGTCTATPEAKLLHQMAALREEVLYVVFLDLHKSYEAWDRSRCLEILEVYGMGPQARRILQTYWRRLKVVTRAGGYYGTYFQGARGVTQDDLLFPNIFNVVMDALVRHWVTGVISDAEERRGARRSAASGERRRGIRLPF